MPTHGYIRASTAKQELSPKVQLEKMLDYCAKHSLGKPLIYQDKETTSKIAIHDRESGGKLMASVRNGDHVIVAKLDRMFRSMRDCVNIVEDFAKRDIHLHVMNLLGGSIDLTNIMGRTMMYIAAMFAELERELICERTRDTMQSLKRAGMKTGGLAPYGYMQATRKDGSGRTIMKSDKEGRRVPRVFLVPCETERAVGQAIVRLYEGSADVRGMDYHEIAASLQATGTMTKHGKPWHHHNVFRAYHAEKTLQMKERVTSAKDNHSDAAAH